MNEILSLAADPAAWAALVTLVVAGCGLFVEDDSALALTCDMDGYLAERADLAADLDAAIGDPRATDVGACRAVAVGAKACGGPRSYAVYSTLTSDAEAVVRLAAEIEALDERANRVCQLVSECAFVEEPAVVVVDGRCEARP